MSGRQASLLLEQSSRGIRSGSLRDVLGEEQNITLSSSAENRLLFREHISKSSECTFFIDERVESLPFLGVRGIGVLGSTMLIKPMIELLRMLDSVELAVVEIPASDLKKSFEA